MKAQFGQNAILGLSVAAIFVIGGCFLTRESSRQNAHYSSPQPPPAVTGVAKLDTPR